MFQRKKSFVDWLEDIYKVLFVIGLVVALVVILLTVYGG